MAGVLELTSEAADVEKPIAAAEDAAAIAAAFDVVGVEGSGVAGSL